MIARPEYKNFQPYGTVLCRPETQPADSGPFHDYWHAWHMEEFAGERLVTGCLSIRSHEPLVREVERHIGCSEVFVVLKGSGILTVAHPDAYAENPRAALRFFRLEAGDAVLIRRGIWHKLPVPVTDCIDFLMLVPERILSDVEKQSLAGDVRVAMK